MLILGGGLAGLAASHASGAPIYEAADRVGGVASSRRVEGFTFDYGIHVLQTDHAVIHKIFDEVGIELATRQRKAMIYSHRTYTHYPFQINTAGLPLSLRTRCLWKYFRRHQQAKPENYQDWIYQTVGTGFGDTFLIPYSDKFWTVHPREMTYEWTGNRVPATNAWRVLRGALFSKQTKVGSNSVFQYPEEPGNGFGIIPSQMAAAVENVHLNHRATRIDTRRRTVTFAEQRVEVPYESLISTIPLPALIRLIPEAPAAVQEAAGLLRHNSICVVNLGVDRPSLSDQHWVHFPETDICFFRISFPQNLSAGLVPPGMSSVSAEVSYSPWKPLDRGTIVDRVQQDLIRIGILKPSDRIVVRDVMNIPCAYVIYDKNRKAAVSVIHDWLKSVDIYPTGRYGLWAYLWSHEAILAGRQTAQRLCEKVPANREVA